MKKLFQLSFLLMLAMSVGIFAQKTWNGSSSTTWTIAGNWTPSGVPGAGDNVTIPSAPVNQPFINSSTNGNCANLTINLGATLTISNTGDLILDGNGSNDRTATINGTLILSSTGTLTESGNSTKTLVLNSGSLLKITGTSFTFPTLNAQTINTNSTVEYGAAGNQTCTVLTYGNLTLSGSGTKTTTGVTVNGILSMEGTATVSAAPTFGASATLQYKGSALQPAGAEWPATFTASGGVVIDNASGVSISAAKTINSILTFTNGNLNTGSNTVTFGPSATITGEATGTYLVGNLTTTRLVGTGAFNVAGLTIAAGEDVGSITLIRISGTPPVGTGSKLNRSWNMSITGSQPLSVGRDVTFSWVSDDDGDVDLTLAVVFKSTDNGVNWFNASAIGGQDVSGTRSIVAPGVTSFSLWTVSDATSPLPVELTSFITALDKNNVLLNWETATEVQNYGFEVERLQDYNIEKLQDWKKIGFVKGNGNSNSPKFYSYKDNKLPSGTYYYRLKQVDTDGSFDYSNELEVTVIEIPESFVLEQNYPNPFNPSTTIKFGIVETAQTVVKIYDAIGNEVTELFNEVAEGGKYYYVNFNASDYASGIYYYTITSGVSKAVKKMLLLK